jgi:hypothetical protein
MDIAEEYLCLDEAYARYLGGLRWAPGCDAIDLADGSTYAFSFQIGSFLEGYLAGGSLIHFGFVLHLIGVLRRQDPDSLRGPRQLVRHAFQVAGRSHRNAGIFFATLCRDVPPVPGPPVGADLLWRLQYPPHEPPALDPRHSRAGVAPPRTAGWFEDLIRRALEAYSFDDLLHWFRHGKGPIKDVQPLARAVTARPPALAGVLAELAHNPRLAGALPYVGRFVSALTLPRRRLDLHELPTGGYDDITTRGDLARVIPVQLALDTDEFVRRYARGELLFFRREEPHARTRDELVVLLDQGVRTWGTTRLLLAAAALALGRYAERRRLMLRVAATSGPATLDPLMAEAGALEALVEASDLSPHPGLALERVLEEAAGNACDVVLLTHPRNLAEQDVAAAARRTPRGARLFALTVTAEGEAELSELRRGAPVSLSRFRAAAESIDPPFSPKSPRVTGDWGADVEAVPFPFRFGVASQHGKMRIAFDRSGAWLLMAATNGMLHAVRTDGSGTEIWPRPVRGGSVMNPVEAVVGVAGGFVVAGTLNGRRMAAHYDVATRTCRLHDPGISEPAGKSAWWWYDRIAHALVAEIRGRLWSVDLTTGHTESAKGFGPGLVPERVSPPQFRPLRSPGSTDAGSVSGFRTVECASATPPTEPGDFPWPAVMFDGSTGTLAVGGVAGWGTFTPQSDGRSALAGCSLEDADCQGGTLAVVFVDPRRASSSRVLRLFRAPEGVPDGEYPMRGEAFALSYDGRLLGLQVARNRVEVRDAALRGPALCATPVGRFHPTIDVMLTDDGIRIQNGVCRHVVRWGDGRLACEIVTSPQRSPGSGTPVTSTKLPEWLTDKKRFVKCAYGLLTAVVDVFGQVSLFDCDRNLVCMLFTFRNRLAAWTRDGTRFGSAALHGGEPTPGAAEKVGAALRAACMRSLVRDLI